MFNDSLITNPTKCGTAGGLLTILVVNISGNDILRTILLAAIGASVSFVISLVWKWIWKKWGR